MQLFSRVADDSRDATRRRLNQRTGCHRLTLASISREPLRLVTSHSSCDKRQRGQLKNKLWEATLSATAHCHTFVADRVASHKKTGGYSSADPNPSPG